jgi:hypothetical protein
MFDVINDNAGALANCAVLKLLASAVTTVHDNSHQHQGANGRG